LSFDRNWVSPAMRCIGGSIAGLAVGALGWRLELRYRTYGAALIGAGAGIIYLCIWAACKLYGVLPSATGIVGGLSGGVPGGGRRIFGGIRTFSGNNRQGRCFT